MTGVLAYNPQRVALLATMTQQASDTLSLVAQDDPCCESAAEVARTIAGGLADSLRTSLQTLLADRSMIDPFDTTPIPIADLLAALTAPRPPVPPFVLDDGQFSLANAITASSEANWQYLVDTPTCVGFEGTYEGGGFVTDHRGVSYPIVVARVETESGDVFTADRAPVRPDEPSVATLGGSDPGWEIVGCATGIERFQKSPSLAEGFAGFLAGTSGLVGPLPPNSGLAHIEVSDRGGTPWFTTEPMTPGRVVTPQTVDTPDPADSSPGVVLEGRVALGVTVVQGSVMASAMDNQTQRAYRVLFERNTDGRRRARIETYTLAHDGYGGVSIIPEHVWVDAEGNLMSETISYGGPFAPDYPMITSGVPDVANFAFSGNEPFQYEVPSAVFP